MVDQSKAGSAGTRFGTYVEELQEFFQSRAVRYGSPQDLPAFAERVTVSGSFQDEMGSLVRSIFFQESENLGRADLLEIVTHAVGGPTVDAGTQGMQDSVRQIFMFVTGALRQSSGLNAAEPEVPENPQVTAGDILAAPFGLSRREEAALAARIPQNGPHDVPQQGATPREAIPLRTEVTRVTPVNNNTGSGVLFKPAPLPDHDDDLYQPPPRSNRWVIPAVIAGVIAVGLGGYSLRTVTTAPGGPSSASSGAPLTQPTAGPTAGSCVNAPASSVSRAYLQERGRWAHNLIDQKLYEAALPELTDLARVDPGFPGVNLDLSNTLMQLKRPEDARDAVDKQINLSECLAKLPSAALDKYCSTEFTPSAVGGCRQQLMHIRQQAELQAALVHLELGHEAAPESAAVSAAPQSQATSPAAAHRPALAEARPRPAAPVTRPRVATEPRPAARTPAADNSLVNGAGTDSAFGAYSKPQ